MVHKSEDFNLFILYASDKLQLMMECQMPDASAIPAHILWVELCMRIPTRPLHYQPGAEEVAMHSFHRLFNTVRGLMAEYPKANEFQKLAREMLNDHVLRCCLTRWHAWTAENVLGDESVRRQIRDDLRELKQHLQGYEQALRAMGGTPVSKSRKVFDTIE